MARARSASARRRSTSVISSAPDRSDRGLPDRAGIAYAAPQWRRLCRSAPHNARQGTQALQPSAHIARGSLSCTVQSIGKSARWPAACEARPFLCKYLQPRRHRRAGLFRLSALRYDQPRSSLYTPLRQDLRKPARPSAAADFSLRLHGIFLLTPDRPGGCHISDPPGSPARAFSCALLAVSSGLPVADQGRAPCRSLRPS